jgi:lipopolysaccharide export system permease protein
MFRSMSLYLFRQHALTVLGVAAILTGGIWISQSLRMISMIVNEGLSLTTFVWLTSLYVPSFFTLALPVAGTIATIMVLSRAQADNEITAMRAAGRSPLQIAAPVFATAVLAIVIGYGLTLWFLPSAFRELRALQQEITRDAAVLLIQEGAFSAIAPGVTVYIQRREPSGDMRGVFVHDARNPAEASTIFADRGRFVASEAGPRFVLIEGTRQQFDRARARLQVLQFERNTIEIARLQSGQQEPWLGPEERYLSELMSIGTSERDRRFAGRLRVEFHRRLTTPLLSLACVLIPLAMLLTGEFNRRGRWARVIAAGVMVVLVQIAYLVGINMSVQNPAVIPLIYLAILLPALGAGVAMAIDRPHLLLRRAAAPAG